MKTPGNPFHYIFALDDSGSMGNKDGNFLNRWD
jgi:hypothetical protein